MNQQKISTKTLVISSIVAGIIFYVFLYIVSKWFPVWTGRSLTNEWILIFVSAIPLLIVLAFMLAGNIAKAKIGGFEFEFEQHIPDALLDSFQLEQNIAQEFLMKGSQDALERIARDIGNLSKMPTFLLIPLEELSIDFRVMRQYIYRLSEVAPIRFIIFLGFDRKYLGFTTVENFKAKFPVLNIEQLLEALENERVMRPELPVPFNQIPQEKIEQYLDRLAYRQWNRGFGTPRKQSVEKSDLGRISASDGKVQITSSPINVYWFLLENGLEGVPVVDAKGKFIGIVSKDRIAESVILQLLQKSTKAEAK